MPNRELIIEAGRAERLYWKDLWNYRELFYFLAWRDILVRYKQTVIGILWALLRPLLIMLVFTIVFGKLAKLPSEGVPYPILVFAAMLPWQFFANAFSESSNSLIGNANLISKVYFPRLVIPTSSVIVSFVDFLISGIILIGLMLWYNFWPSWRLIALPALIVVAFAAAMGAGLLNKFFMRMPGIVLRQEAIKNTGLPISELYMVHDWEYFLRISKNWKSFLLEKPGAVYRLHSNSVTINAGRNNRIMKDFQFWLDVSSKKAIPYHINKKERRALSLGMAQTYLRIQIMPNDKIFFNYRCYLHLIRAGKLVTRESPLILPSLIWFILRSIARLLRKKIMRTIKSTGTQKDNGAIHIKHLLPQVIASVNQRIAHESNYRMSIANGRQN